MGLPLINYLPFEALQTLYGEFKAPVVRVTTGSNIVTLLLAALAPVGFTGFITDGVSITLNKDTASSATFNVINCYDSQKHKFKSSVKIGSKICILLGYGSVMKTVFAGYVDSVNYEFSDTPKMTVTAFDGVKLMMESGTTERTWDDGGMYVATITEIMTRYADICPLLPTGIVPTMKTHGMLKQNSNDYDYIKNILCKYCDRDFIVKGGNSYLVSHDQQFGKLTELGPGRGLLSCAVETGYMKVKARVTGDMLANVYAESSVSMGASYSSAMNKPTEISKQAPLKTKSDCKTYADRLAFDEIQKVKTSRGTCVGIPDIVPGVGIGYRNVEADWDKGTYYVDTATHTLNSSGYTVSFTTKGWK